MQWENVGTVRTRQEWVSRVSDRWKAKFNLFVLLNAMGICWYCENKAGMGEHSER